MSGSVPCLEHSQKDHRYGSCSLNGRKLGFHQRAWILTHGEIPSGLQVLHACDNMRCYEITHLFLGTIADNIRDAVSKGRWGNRAPGYNSLVRATAYNGMKKVSDEDVVTIRKTYLRGGIRQKDLAITYGVDPSMISKIVNKKERTRCV